MLVAQLPSRPHAAVGGTNMRYKVKIKLRINSTTTTTTIDIDAANANVAKALAEDMYGVGNVLAVIKTS
jgi:hypothetical protein